MLYTVHFPENIGKIDLENRELKRSKTVHAENVKWTKDMIEQQRNMPHNQFQLIIAIAVVE